MSGVPVAPGMRTSAGRGGSAVVGAALGAVGHDPALSLLGMLGFGVRGGIVLLALPILTIPSPVLLAVVFRDQIGTAGPSDGFGMSAFLVALATALCVLGAILVSAWCELAAFERTVGAPVARDLRLGREPRVFGRPERRGLWLWIAAIQAVALIPVLLLVSIVVGGLQGAVTSEVQRPTDLATPLLLRVVSGFGPAIVVFIVLVALGEVVVSTATRRLLTARAGCLPDGVGEPTETGLAMAGALRTLTRPARVWPVALLSWLLAVAGLGVALVAITVGWSVTRPALDALGTTGPSQVEVAFGLVGPLLVLGLMCGIWVAGLALCGLVAAIRTALWTMESLR